MSDRAADTGTELPPELSHFIDRYERGEYWRSHEDLETLWLRDRRDCYKGLIHLAAALLHARRGNGRGARTKIETAREYLEADRCCPGFDGEDLLQTVVQAERALPADPTAADLSRWEAARPALRPLFAQPVPEGIAPPEELPYRVRRHAEGYRPGRDPRARD